MIFKNKLYYLLQIHFFMYICNSKQHLIRENYGNQNCITTNYY